MVDIILIYPFYKRRFDKSPFRFPPLGLGYIASVLKQNNFSVRILDGTFKGEKELIDEVKSHRPKIIGIYSMYSNDLESLSIAKKVRNYSNLLVVGGPSPTVNPVSFLSDFDIVVLGEGENTMLEVATNSLKDNDIKDINGLAIKIGDKVHYTKKRENIEDIDSFPFPARELFDNDAYKEYHKRLFGQNMTSMISSRGCPFDCDFCSRPIFENSFRVRSPVNVVDEMESIYNQGYDAIWFADDCFTIHRDRIMRICDEIISRELIIKWHCLSRVDSIDSELTMRMKEAGCQRIYFGIESGDDDVLRMIMNKGFDVSTAKRAVFDTKSSNIETGGFFILGYPGESNESILNTINFATSLPLDYVSFTLPYPIPGTGLYEKVKHTINDSKKKKIPILNHDLLFRSDFSEFKLKFAIVKGAIQFRIRKYFGRKGYRILGILFEKISDRAFKALN